MSEQFSCKLEIYKGSIQPLPSRSCHLADRIYKDTQSIQPSDLNWQWNKVERRNKVKLEGGGRVVTEVIKKQ